MIPRKLAERAIRNLPLLIIPVVLAPAIVIAVVGGATPEFRSIATIWVTEPQGIGDTILGAEQRFVSPAGRQVGALGQLLRTEAFADSVAAEAGIIDTIDPELLATLSDEQLIRRARLITTGAIRVRAEGVNLMSIAAVDTSPGVAQALVTAVVNQYRLRIDSEGARQTEIAQQYFEGQLVLAEQSLLQSKDTLNAYVTVNPEAPGSFDLEFSTLQRRVSSQESIVGSLLGQLQNVHLDAATLSQSEAARFNVQDPPSAATLQVEGVTARYGPAIAAFAIGLLVSAGYLYVTYRADHTIQSSEDLVGLGVPVVGYIPELNSKREHPWYRRIGRRRPNFAREIAASLITPPEGRPS